MKKIVYVLITILLSFSLSIEVLADGPSNESEGTYDTVKEMEITL